ncbi:MAG: hypothetical protein KKE20_05860 [Nanoarchaeota archaeon]|nr:hypothetical protein [Nanoarchaeota archaeon]
MCGRIRVGNLFFYNPLSKCRDLCEEINSEAVQKSLESKLAGILCFFEGSKDPAYFVVEGLDTMINSRTGDYYDPPVDVLSIGEIIKKRRQGRKNKVQSSDSQAPLRRADDPDTKYLIYVDRGLERNGKDFRERIFHKMTESLARYGLTDQFLFSMEYWLQLKPKNPMTAVITLMITADRYADDRGNHRGVGLMFSEYLGQIIDEGIKNTRFDYNKAVSVYNDINSNKFKRESRLFTLEQVDRS